MKLTTRLALVLAVSATSMAACGAEGCEDSVFVQVSEQAMTVTPKDVTVCRNGTVEWNSEGPSRFQVVFPGRRAGPTTRDDPTTHVIQATSEAGEYPYNVQIRGVDLDPRIIIQ
jgi:plastocyanin